MLLKGTRLNIRDMLPNIRSCYIYVHDKLSEKIRHYLFGKVFVVKFSPGGFGFRVDVALDSAKECVEALELLRGNVMFYNGCTEPLRQAHIHASNVYT